MRYDNRSSRRAGGGRPSPGRRPAGRPAGRAAGRREPNPRSARHERDEYDEEEEYYEPPTSSNAVPWIVVSVLVVAVFSVIIYLGTQGDGKDGDDAGGVSRGTLESLRYGTFNNVRYDVQMHQTRLTETETTSRQFNERIHGVLTLSSSPGSGTAAMDVGFYEVGTDRMEKKAAGASPIHGKTISFRTGDIGDFQTSSEGDETLLFRALLTGIFQDLPPGRVNWKRKDTWALHAPDALFAVLPWPGRATISEIQKFDSTLRAGASGDFLNWPDCVKIFHKPGVKMFGKARLEDNGEQVLALIRMEMSGESVLDWANGVPCQAHAEFDTRIVIRPRTPLEKKIICKIKVLANRMPD
jgi:hypothetical protein